MLTRFSVAALAASIPGCISASSLDESYDFVIAGGGTAGLTIANRISAALPNRTVLVVEYGGNTPRSGIYEPPYVNTDTDSIFSYDDAIPTLGNRKPRTFEVGKTLGGSSAVNGQFFDRASRHDYDMWSNYSESSDWSWDGLKPYFQKSVTFWEPPDEVAEEFGFTWDLDAYGGSGPVNSSYPTYSWPTTNVSRQAWLEVGLEARQECANGDKAGLCWMAMSQNPYDGSRSHAAIGHYDDIISSRANLHVATFHQVTRVLYTGDDLADQVPVVEVKYLNDSTVYNVSARAEVILSAGAVHTPWILQRSGIGPSDVIEEAGVDLVLDMPGVGWNFQDHAGAQYSVDITNNVSPNADELDANDTMVSRAEELYSLRPAQGPYTQADAHLGAFPALSAITGEYRSLAAAVRRQLSNGSADSYLLPGTPDTVRAGYHEQLSHLADLLENTDQPIMEGWTNGVPDYGTLLHPLSRGSILLNTSNVEGEPVINFNTASNPIDLDLHVHFIHLYRKVWSTSALKSIGVVETSPGANVTRAADLKDWLINKGLVQTDYHPCCTAAIAPLSKGGVLGADLRVHGLNRLRVADLSVPPMELGTHTQSTAYAIGEKAAALIIADWS